MSIDNIPVRVIGPGSQPGDPDGGALNYINLPSDMSTYRPPAAPDPDTLRESAGAREAMRWLREALGRYAKGCEPLLLDLTALDQGNRELVNQILGEGEVSVSYRGRATARTQESVLAGVWRTLYVDTDDRVVCDVLEVADAPHVAESSEGRDRVIDTAADGVPADVVNALPLLVELDAQCAEYLRTGRTHVINLTLLPLTDADREFLELRLGQGPVEVLSRSYGKCQIVSTATPNVWWVRYYNSMGVMILNTLEVVDVPAVIRAAPEDLADSASRLEAILEPYGAELS